MLERSAVPHGPRFWTRWGVPLATVAPASGTNQRTGRKTRPHPPPLAARGMVPPPPAPPAGSTVLKGTGFVPVPRYSRMLGFAGHDPTGTTGSWHRRPRQGQAVEGAAGPPAAPFAFGMLI